MANGDSVRRCVRNNWTNEVAQTDLKNRKINREKQRTSDNMDTEIAMAQMDP